MQEIFIVRNPDCCAYMELMTHGQALRAMRERKDWRQQDLASRAGLSVSLIRQLEDAETIRGRESTWRCLADALGFQNVEAFQRALSEASEETRGLFVRRQTAEAVEAAAAAHKMSLDDWLNARAVEKAQVVIRQEDQSTSPRKGTTSRKSPSRVGGSDISALSKS
jgi:transcriptional regulator with XRE-family HTH domain